MTDEAEVRNDSSLGRNPPHPGESIREGCMEEMTVGRQPHLPLNRDAPTTFAAGSRTPWLESVPSATSPWT